MEKKVLALTALWDIEKSVGVKCTLDIVEVRDVSMHTVASDVAQQMERRVSYKKAMKRAIQNVMRAGAKGVRINCAGRLGGIEIARTECTGRTIALAFVAF